jgi:bidirectional [NiFe] hydrogenase diaphorase subunit
MTERTTARARPRAEASPHPSGDDRFNLIDKHLKRVRYAQDELIETLHLAQDIFGCLDDGILIYLAHALRLPPSMVYGVATFYHLFTFEAPGEHSCTVCTGTACFVKGADDIVSQISEAHDVPAGTTTEDGSLTLRTARCIGSCGLAPVMVLDGEVLARQTPETALEFVGAAFAAGGDA